MNKLAIAALAVALTACSSSRVSRFDEFEAVKVHKMVGNNVKPQWVGRTVICLNAMREERWPAPVTNQAVAWSTNLAVSSFTNYTVTSSSNQQLANSTNLTLPPPLALSLTNGTPAETNDAPASPPGPADTLQGGTVLSSTENESVATGPNQHVLTRSIQSVILLNRQATVNSNNLALTTGTNQTITVETNWVITTLTNQVVSPITNTTVKTAERPVHDYFLYTEIAPADFALAPGENLVLLVDDRRYAFSSASPTAGWQGRRGWLTTHYRVPPEVISQIANAKSVKLRLKTTGGTVERNLSRGSIGNFREFLLKSFEQAEGIPETPAVAGAESAAANAVGI